MTVPGVSCKALATQNSSEWPCSMCPIPPGSGLWGWGHPAYIFLIFPGHPESWTPLQIPSWGPPLGCTLLHYDSCVSRRKITLWAPWVWPWRFLDKKKKLFEGRSGHMGNMNKGLLPESRIRENQGTPPSLRIFVGGGSSQWLLSRILKLLYVCLPVFPFMNRRFYLVFAGSLCFVCCGSLQIICLFR